MALDDELAALLGEDRVRLIGLERVTVPGIRLLDLLPSRPVVSLPLVVELLGVSNPTAINAIEILEETGILRETPGKRRDRVYAIRSISMC